ncbi:uncharacterized protein LOC111623621 isoform X2 [Centruroides sculpturatus]|uniref:uncharacterized protein LOC111623621 isoform X2 n=1 Tax=Centruroides sculpturatus TaxID=218467 RepID=UPI000C6EA4A1|nr:uncharacterized protein LOC111623621 isoform X2 [Centruroides sculpturatus]
MDTWNRRMVSQSKNRRNNKNGICEEVLGECYCEDAIQVQQLCNSGQQSHARYVFGSLLVMLHLLGISTDHRSAPSRWECFLIKLINATVLCVMINDVYVIFIHNVTPSLLRNVLCSLYVGSAIYSHRKMRYLAAEILDSLDKHSYLIVPDKQGIKYIRRWSLVLTISGILLLLAYLSASLILVKFYGFRSVIKGYALGVSEVNVWISALIFVLMVVAGVVVLMPLYYVVAFYSLITLFLSCLFSSHSRLTIRSIKIKLSSQKEHTQQSFSFYCHLCELVKVIDNILSYPSMIWLIVNLSMVFSLAHNFITTYSKVNFVIDWGIYFVPALFSIFAFVVQCFAGDTLSENSRSLIPSLRKYSLKQNAATDLSNFVDLILDRMRLHPPVLTVFGFVEINNNLILSLFSIVIAYMAIISQIPAEHFD